MNISGPYNLHVKKRNIWRIDEKYLILRVLPCVTGAIKHMGGRCETLTWFQYAEICGQMSQDPVGKCFHYVNKCRIYFYQNVTFPDIVMLPNITKMLIMTAKMLLFSTPIFNNVHCCHHTILSQLFLLNVLLLLQYTKYTNLK